MCVFVVHGCVYCKLCVSFFRVCTHPLTCCPLSLSCAALGAAYGTAKSGTGIAAMSVMRPELIMKSIIPVVMAGIIAIYGLVVSVLIAQGLGSASTYSLFKYVFWGLCGWWREGGDFCFGHCNES